MKASDLKALFSFAPSLSLNSFFSGERAERGGEELHSAPLESPLSSLPFPIFVMGHSSAFGAPLLLFLRSFKTRNNTTIDMPTRDANNGLNRRRERALSIQRRLSRRSRHFLPCRGRSSERRMGGLSSHRSDRKRDGHGQRPMITRKGGLETERETRERN